MVPVLVSVLFSLGGCSQDPTQDVPPAAAPTTDRIVLASMGYAPEQIEEYETFYLIGEQIVSKKRLEEVRNESDTRIQYETDRMLDVEHQQIPLSITGAFSTQIQQAAEEWNKLYSAKNSNIHFDINPSGKNKVEFITEMLSAQNYLSLSVEKPRKGVNGWLVYLKIGNNWYDLMSNNQMKYLMMHALGHLVGFDHALDYGDGIPPGGWTAGDLFDPTSIMMPEKGLLTNKNLYNGFSPSDRTAINTVYPYIAPTPPEPEVPEFTITCTPAGTGTGKQNLVWNTEYEFTASYKYSSCSTPVYQFTIAAEEGFVANFVSRSTGNGKQKVKFIYPGKYKITVKVTNSDVNNTLTKTFNVITPEAKISGPDGIELGKVYDYYVAYWNPAYPQVAFNLRWQETMFGTGHANIERINNHRFRIRFDEPGDYVITGDISNGPDIKTELSAAEIYYRPYYRIWKKRISVAGGILPGNGPEMDNDIPFRHKYTVATTYSNVLRFYADEACTQPISLEHDIVFDRNQIYRVLQGDEQRDEQGSIVRMIVRKGQSEVTLPTTQKFKSRTTNLTKDPFYRIDYLPDQSSGRL